MEGDGFAPLAVVVVHSVALTLPSLGARINLLEFAVAAWLGSKSLASVVYGLLMEVECEAPKINAGYNKS